MEREGGVADAASRIGLSTVMMRMMMMMSSMVALVRKEVQSSGRRSSVVESSSSSSSSVLVVVVFRIRSVSLLFSCVLRIRPLSSEGGQLRVRGRGWRFGLVCAPCVGGLGTC